MNIHNVKSVLPCSDEEAWAILGLHFSYPRFQFHLNENPATGMTRVEYKETYDRRFAPLADYNLAYWVRQGHSGFAAIDPDLIQRLTQGAS